MCQIRALVHLLLVDNARVTVLYCNTVKVNYECYYKNKR